MVFVNSLTDMYDKLTPKFLPGKLRQIKTLLGSDNLTGLKGGGNHKSI
jgi:5'-3' exonuclease